MLRPQGKSRATRQSDLHYPVQAEVEFVVRRGAHSVQTGSGQAVALSESEITLDSAHPLASGMEIELTLPWPGSPGSAEGCCCKSRGKRCGARGTARQSTLRNTDWKCGPNRKRCLRSNEPPKANRRNRASVRTCRTSLRWLHKGAQPQGSGPGPRRDLSSAPRCSPGF